MHPARIFSWWESNEGWKSKIHLYNFLKEGFSEGVYVYFDFSLLRGLGTLIGNSNFAPRVENTEIDYNFYYK